MEKLKPPHLKQPSAIPAVVEGKDDLFGGGAEVFVVFVGGEVFAEGAEDVLDAVGGAGFADDAEEGKRSKLRRCKSEMLKKEGVSGFLGVGVEVQKGGAAQHVLVDGE
jgi:hypothetical protein